MKKIALCLIIMCSLIFTGCFNYRDINKLVFSIALVVDIDEDNNPVEGVEIWVIIYDNTLEVVDIQQMEEQEGGSYEADIEDPPSTYYWWNAIIETDDVDPDPGPNPFIPEQNFWYNQTKQWEVDDNR